MLTVIENIDIENTIQRNTNDSNLNIKGFLKPTASGFNVAQTFKYISTDNKSNNSLNTSFLLLSRDEKDLILIF